MSSPCPACHALVPDSLTQCANCGWSGSAVPAPASISGQERLIAGLCYLTFVPAVVLLFVEPYRHRPFIRFHSFQSIVFFAASVLCATVLGVLSPIIFGQVLTLLLYMLLAMGWAILWVVMVAKAAAGERFLLPRLGDWGVQAELRWTRSHP